MVHPLPVIHIAGETA